MSNHRTTSGVVATKPTAAAKASTPAAKPMARAARGLIYFVSALVMVASLAAEPLEEPSQYESTMP